MNPEDLEAFKRQLTDYSDKKAHISLDEDLTIEKIKELKNFGILCKPKPPKQRKIWELVPTKSDTVIPVEFFETIFGFKISPDAFIGIPAPVEEKTEPVIKSQEDFKNKMPKQQNFTPEKQEKRNNFSIHSNEQPKQQQQDEDPEPVPEAPAEPNRKTGAFRIKQEMPQEQYQNPKERHFPRLQPRHNDEYQRPPMQNRSDNPYYDNGEDDEEQRPMRNRGRRFDRPGYERQDDFGRQGGFDRQGRNYHRNSDQNYYEDEPRDEPIPERPPMNPRAIEKTQKNELSTEDFPALEPAANKPPQEQKEEEQKEAAPVQEVKEQPKNQNVGWKGVLEDEPPIDDDEQWKKIHDASYLKAVKNGKTLIIGGNSFLQSKILKFIKNTISENLEDEDEVDVDELFEDISQIQFK